MNPQPITPTPAEAAALLALVPVSHTRKCVDWSYPSSVNATAAGWGRQGCWTLSVEDPTGANTPVALASFDHREQALATARALPLAWSGAFRHCHPLDATP